MKVEIVVPSGMEYPAFYRESSKPATPSVWLSDTPDHPELQRSTQKFPVVCTDMVLVDSKGRFVLAKRRHACAQGWWWKGGGLNQDKTPEENLASLLAREIGYVPESVVYLRNFFHYWNDTRERPGGGRLDNIYLHFWVVTESEIDQITLDPVEYDVEAGFMRYDGSQEVRLVVRESYVRFCALRSRQPELFACD